MAIAYVNGAQTSQASALSLTVTKPAGLADGDVLLAHIVQGGSVPVTAPAGWVAWPLVTNTITTIIYYKVITNAAGEPANYTWTVGIASLATGQIAAYRGVDTDHPIAALVSATGNSVSAVAPTFTPVLDGVMVVALHAFNIAASMAISNPAGYTVRLEDQDSVGLEAQVADILQGAAAATGTATGTIGFGTQWIAIHLGLNPISTHPTFVGASSVSTNNGTTVTIAVPAGTADGDLMLMAFAKDTNSWTAPAGWTLIQAEGSLASVKYGAVYYRWAASEPANYQWVGNANSDAEAIISVYRGVHLTTPINVSAESLLTTSASTIDVPDATSTVASGLAVHIGLEIGTTTTITPHASVTQRAEIDNVTGVLVTANLGDEVLAAAGTVTGRDLALGSASSWRYGVLVVLTPRPPDVSAALEVASVVLAARDLSSVIAARTFTVDSSAIVLSAMDLTGVIAARILGFDAAAVTLVAHDGIAGTLLVMETAPDAVLTAQDVSTVLAALAVDLDPATVILDAQDFTYSVFYPDIGLVIGTLEALATFDSLRGVIGAELERTLTFDRLES